MRAAARHLVALRRQTVPGQAHLRTTSTQQQTPQSSSDKTQDLRFGRLPTVGPVSWRLISAVPLLATAEEATSIGVSPPWALVAGSLIGLPVALWAYKCLMMVLFQRSIIYMGLWPPGARSTAIDPSDPALRHLDVKSVEIPGGSDGVVLRGVKLSRKDDLTTREGTKTLVVYFQGNMGSPVHRIPLFSHLLTSPSSPFHSDSTTLLCISPRSYYLSTNAKPTQTGFLADYRQILLHAQETHPTHRLIVYSHSLGSAILACLLGSPQFSVGLKAPSAAILENPMPSIPTMVERSLYRSKWVPYHFLSPFVLDQWDSHAAFRQPDTLLQRTPVLFISGEKDSLVRPELVKETFELAIAHSREQGGAERRWLSVKEASHDDAWARKGPWGKGVKDFLYEIEQGGST